MDLIYCAGGNRKLANIAVEEGFLYGARSDDIRQGLRCEGLIDIRWDNYDWHRHLDHVAFHQPKYAVVPDVMDPHDLAHTLQLATQLEAHCHRVIVVPKVPGVVKDIPSTYLVGISVPTSYAGFLPNSEELKGRDLHLLGGSPLQQRNLWLEYNSIKAKVLSVDLNCHAKASDFGSYWDGSKWRDDERASIGKYPAFRKSCRGIVRMWKSLGALS